MTKTPPQPHDPEIDRYIDSLWSQKGLADLTLRAYQQDLRQFSRWLGLRNQKLVSADQSGIQDFLAERFDGGASARSNARLLSTLKQYYRHLIKLGKRQDNPTALISAPRIHRTLPQSLTESDMEKLLSAPDLETDFGMRDRCMLELMYRAQICTVIEQVRGKSVTQRMWREYRFHTRLEQVFLDILPKCLARYRATATR